MKLFLVKLLSLIFLQFSVAESYGQAQKITVTGKVIESNSGQVVMFATVVLQELNSSKIIDGVTTAEDGTFLLKSDVANFQIQISFLGFETKTITDFKVVNGKVQLGAIKLSQSATNLNAVEIESEKSQTVFKLDKRVFNVGQDISSTGANALEVLNNVPSVSVNIEGQVSLRGSQGVQILINGKPSILTNSDGNALGTITADMIDKVEVITNPSAKYDAEGTSGIINIVLKKEEKEGLNGSVSLNTGIPDNHSVGISMNRRTDKFNLFSQLGAGYRSLPRDQININNDLVNKTVVESEGTEYRNETFYNMTLGADYHINRLNVLTLSGNFAYEVEDQPSLTNFSQYENDSLISHWYRDETTEATNPKWQYELQYQRDYDNDEDHKLLVSALGSFFGKEQSSEFRNVTTFGEQADPLQRTETDFSEANFTFKADYTHPINEFFSYEAGSQYVITDVSNEYAVTNFISNIWIPDTGLTNLFEYDQKVLGVYGTFAFEKDKWGVKGGLRIENTDLKTVLTNTNEENNQNYTDYFPSMHASYKLTETFSFQAGYSRRIYRPRLWDLNPFFNIRNNYSIRTGNPRLQPEYTDSYEFTSIFIRDKYSINFGIYHLYTTEVIERISTFENNVNIYKPENIGTNQATGFELNGKYNASKIISFQGDFNYNIFNRTGSYEQESFDFNGDRWSAKLTTKVKLPFKFDIEITGNYESEYQTVQSIISENVHMDIGIRKKILNGKTVVSMSIRDVFESRENESVISEPEYYNYNYSQRGRFFTLSLSYGFGKGEAMEYSGGRRR